MESKSGHEEQETRSIFQGDEICIGRILGREPSIGQSSRIFHRSPDGVPFKWEKNPGTPIHPRQEDRIFPLSPSPMMQSSRLPLPNIHPQDGETKDSTLWGFTKMSKKKVIGDLRKKVESVLDWRRRKRETSSIFGDPNDVRYVGSPKCSSFSSSSSSLLGFSSNSRVLDASGFGTVEVYPGAYAVEEDDSFLENGQIPAGIPFRWETQPGTPKNPPENEPIPPPSPPPAMQSLSPPLPKLGDGEDEARDRSTRKRAQHSDSLRRSSSYFGCFSPWSRSDFPVLFKRKFK